MFEHARIRPVLASILLAPLLLGACRDTGKLFEISGRLMVFNYRVATVTYLVTLNPIKPIGEGQIAVTTFESPAGGAPLVVRQKLFPEHKKVTIESPPLECVVKDRPYKVSIRIEGANGALLQETETTMVSSQDQSMLPDRPLVVGRATSPTQSWPATRTAGCPAGAG